jgi:Protein of unknown function (DUF2829)
MITLQEIFANTEIKNIRAEAFSAGEKVGIIITHNGAAPVVDSVDPMVRGLIDVVGGQSKTPIMEIHRNTVFPAPPNTAEMMDFAQAISAAQAGYQISRTAWENNPRHISKVLMDDALKPADHQFRDTFALIEAPNITDAPTVTIDWRPTIDDMFATDWEILTMEYLMKRYENFPKG